MPWRRWISRRRGRRPMPVEGAFLPAAKQAFQEPADRRFRPRRTAWRRTADIHEVPGPAIDDGFDDVAGRDFKVEFHLRPVRATFDPGVEQTGILPDGLSGIGQKRFKGNGDAPLAGPQLKSLLTGPGQANA